MIRPSSSLLLAAVLAAYAPSLAAASPAHDPPDHSYTYLGKGGNVTVFGDSKGVARALSFKQGNASVLWFREGGHEYIVRDPDALAQLEAAWTRGRELDVEAQVRQHDGLARKHEQLNAKRDEIKARRDALTERESELAERESEDPVRAGREDLAKQRRDLRREQQALAGELRALEPSLKELRPQMDAIQRQIDVLRLKRELASNAEVCAQFRRAITAGKATPAR
jgi:hypothetical protein